MMSTVALGVLACRFDILGRHTPRLEFSYVTFCDLCDLLRLFSLSVFPLRRARNASRSDADR
jgi:hypothetical protein